MRFLHKIFGRIFIVAILILLQVIWFLTLYFKVIDYSIIINLILRGLGVLAVLSLVRKNEVNPATKLPWVVLLLVLPLLGFLMYLMLYARKPTHWLRRKIEASEAKILPLVTQKEGVIEEIEALDCTVAGEMRYLVNYSNAPVYKNTKTQYFISGEENFPFLLEALEQAEKFIFMEYFILQEGRMWSEILAILKRKAKQGLDVRLIYDDVGSLTYLPFRYDKELEDLGIQCEAFNHFKPIISVVINHRDHRKITVVDGNVGFTGGINLGDEYINEKSRYGYWKDTGIRLEGEGVWKLTEMFLTMWNSIRPTDTEFQQFMPSLNKSYSEKGYVQPFGDSPLDDENVGENVYLNMINSASRYVYIFNPYIVIDNEMMTALCLAAKRGIDIRIITPGVSDSYFVECIADSYFTQLVKAGVKIYAYEPGFIHAKVFLSDDKIATVGTINLDFRSLYLHFECGVLLYNTESIKAIRDDVEKTLAQSKLLTINDFEAGLFRQTMQMILRLFAPLL